MNIHEYQAREIFRSHGLPVPDSVLAESAEQAREAAARFGGTVVIKAQVHAGGRGKAGGVKLASDPAEAGKAAEAILGMEIKGLVVENVLVAVAGSLWLRLRRPRITASCTPWPRAPSAGLRTRPREEGDLQ